ncbi:uncharacterized protein Z519_10289 [Cladophialophora bantiana CBS 173.52]|uniref:medium-chain acyl-CoA ligase n=1 Tax=Cladophialophora bantiana (strain ATCC 10958 / CBS 173.52 / CDC B-1940 / NIH 8579) TaxID=1442370 RepID=A0A0D2HD47_CLAB1|nr:uncharacterized protein Z519_10289 [Cladophialophora bantiana CBS 173.52]KIW88805.1 hypothetical protein Z519_10289 [Cladophialophora bantiana CBS 173.52]
MITEYDIQYRFNWSKATTIIGDETTVKQFRTVRSRCPSEKTVIQVGGLIPEDTFDYYNAIESIPPGIQFESLSLPWDHPAIIYFTSGTSGLPEMVIHKQVSFPLARTREALLEYSGLGLGKGSILIFGAWNCGATLFIFDDRKPFSVHRLLNILNRFPITTLCAPPLVWRQLTLRDSKDYYRLYPPKSLEHCLAAAEALNSEVIRQWKQLSNLNIHDGYGQTETVLLCGNFKDCPIQPGPMGKPAPGIPLNVIDVDRRECAPGEEGNTALKIKSPNEAESFFGIF